MQIHYGFGSPTRGDILQIDPAQPWERRGMELHAIVERYSIADYQQWNGDWELIRGVPLAMSPSPGLRHQRVSAAAFRALAEALDHSPVCEVLFETDVEFSANTVVRPDLLVVCQLPEGDRLTAPPALVAEVISPATRRRDEQTKRTLYEEERAPHYLLIDPEDQSVRWCRLRDGTYEDSGRHHRECIALELESCTAQVSCRRFWSN